MPFIYKIKNVVNNKIYIGKSLKNDDSYLGSGLQILAAIKKYGRENFLKEVLEECSKELVDEREKYWIKHFGSTDDLIGYNISAGGEGGNHYWTTLNEEEKWLHREKISKSRKGQSRGPHSEQTKKKISENQPKDFLFYELCAEKRRQWFTVLNHNTNELFFTKNLKLLCREHNLSYSQMLYNAKVRKTLHLGSWSCRKGILEGSNQQIIDCLNLEIKIATEKIKSTVGKNCKKGDKNPMFNKKHREDSKRKMSESKKKIYETNKNTNQ